MRGPFGLMLRTAAFAPLVGWYAAYLAFFDMDQEPQWWWLATGFMVKGVCTGVAMALVMHHARGARRAFNPLRLRETLPPMVVLGVLVSGIDEAAIAVDSFELLALALAVPTFYVFAAAARGCGVRESLAVSLRHLVRRPGLTIGVAALAQLLLTVGVLSFLVGAVIAVPFVACLQLEAEEQLTAAG